jgi:hypothetical protein
VAVAVGAALRNYNALLDGPDPCTDAEAYSRVSVEIALPTLLADQLMNGPTGYRAHYSVSIEAGELFNRKLVEAVAPLVIRAEYLYSSLFSSRLCSESLLGSFSKFWYSKEVTDPSAQGGLLKLNEVIRFPRWVTYWRTRPKPRKGLLAPIAEASSTYVLLIGTFVGENGKIFEQKPCRSKHLFESGWT